ncbi:MAG: hypothetical protein Q7K40_04375 [bacterium]|nr:hypothetical protein [bacterium]
MKTYITLVLMMALTAFAHAEGGASGVPADENTGHARDAKASLYIGSIRSTVRDLKIANKEGVVLEGKQAHQLATADLLFNAWATFEQENTKHEDNIISQNDFAKNVNGQADSYNGVCHGTVDQNRYNWCQIEKARLDPLVEKVNSWKGEIDTNRDRLIKNIDTLNQIGEKSDREANAIHQAGLKYFEKYNRLVARIKDFSDKLAALKVEYDACKDIQGSLEKAHEVCGRMFDGNIVHETETKYPVPDVAFKFFDGPKRCTPQGTFCLEAIK